MPSGTQDGPHYRIGQDSDRPGRPGMVNTRLGVVHEFALIRLAQSGQFPGQVSISHRVPARAKSIETCPESKLPSSEISEAGTLCAERTTHHLA
jgi:hypothetical protein